MKKYIVYSCLLLSVLWGLYACSDIDNDNVDKTGTGEAVTQDTLQTKFGEFDSQIAYGEHLVLSIGCHDCHTPKKMTEKGPEPDMSLALSGHPAKMPPPDVDRAELERKGLAASDQFTAWVGPWGISYAANLTSDETGIGNWKEENFIISIREGKHKGNPSARSVLPPMPWPMYKHLTDQEIKAIFAYLKSTKPISNVVPAPAPPLAAGQ